MRFLADRQHQRQYTFELVGMMAALSAHIDPYIYRNYITKDEKGCRIMYAEFMKALYGTLDAVLLFWVKLSTDM